MNTKIEKDYTNILKKNEITDKTSYNDFMSRKVIYHGSEQIVEHSIYGFGSSYNDYGSGFYCTSDKDAAKEWACKKGSAGILNKYDIDERCLKILHLDKEHGFTVLHWLTLLLEHRYLGSSFTSLYQTRIDFLKKNYHIDLTGYDIVVGYRADDAYFAFPRAFVDGSLTLEALEEIFDLGHLGLQYVLLSEKAFASLRYLESQEVDPSFGHSYRERISTANDDYAKMLRKSASSLSPRITDLMKNG